MFKPSFGIKCKLCNMILFSKYRGHFVQCKCRACFIDDTGPEGYTRLGGEPSNYERIEVQDYVEDNQEVLNNT